ncbi:MAG: GldG family protein [Acidobacterium ailaaui]|nr:GldG family protein [Pseudacidobacterium ailaaui]MCL6463008.1 GldG family protein [Pseudacidobacterium ailaaui]
MEKQWLKARQTKYAAYVSIYVLLVLAIVVALNVLANRYNKSLDTTANKRYSLSAQTRKIISGLKQDVTIIYFNQSSRFRDGKDLLDEYADLSPRVHIKYVDPDKDPQLARQDGVRDFGTAVVQMGDRKETAKSMTEEGITGALILAIKGEARTVCFATGSGEHQIDDTERDGFSRFRDLLSKDGYQSQTINLLQKAEVPGNCTAIVIAGPTHDYQPSAVDAIRKYVENGGRAFFMLDPPFQLGRSQIDPNTALADLLSSWGITLDQDLVLDLNPIGQLAGLGPQVALVTSYSFHPIVNDLKGTAVGLPLARSLQIKDTSKTSVEELFGSSSTSLATTNLSSAAVNVDDPKNKKGPFPLAAAGTYNTGKENLQGRFVVTGSSSWAANRFLGFNGNGDLALNAVNWLTSDEDLISIRPKERDDRRITMTRAQLGRVRFTSQFGLPLLVVVAGLLVWWKRR